MHLFVLRFFRFSKKREKRRKKEKTGEIRRFSAPDLLRPDALWCQVGLDLSRIKRDLFPAFSRNRTALINLACNLNRCKDTAMVFYGHIFVLSPRVQKNKKTLANSIFGIDNLDFGMYNIVVLELELKEEKMSWKEKVFDLMKKKNLTQKELAKLSGIAESSISRYLRSDQRPRLDVVVNIAKALNVETTYLLDEEDKSVTAYSAISTAVARYGNELTPEEKNRLIALILGTVN